jgi:hypothetical protein
MLRPWTRSKKLRRACGGNAREACTRHIGRGLVSKTRCGWAKRTSSPIAGPGKAHAPVPPTINGPNRLICLVQSVSNVEPAPPSCCRLATAKPCSSISTRSQLKSPSERTPLSSLIRPEGMAPKPWWFRTTSRAPAAADWYKGLGHMLHGADLGNRPVPSNLRQPLEGAHYSEYWHVIGEDRHIYATWSARLD